MKALLFSMILVFNTCHHKDRIDFYASFKDVNSIMRGAELEENGKVIGHVSTIQSKGGFLILGFSLEKDISISPGSVCIITAPLIGVSWVELKQSAEPGKITSNDTLQGMSRKIEPEQSAQPDSAGIIHATFY